MQPKGFNCIEEGDLAMATLKRVYKHTPFVFQGDFFSPKVFIRSIT